MVTMSQVIHTPQIDLFTVTAETASDMYAEDSYVQGMIAVNRAILEAAPNSRSCSVELEIGQHNPAYIIKKSLEMKGFNVSLSYNHELKTVKAKIDWLERV